jgi:RNA polymerase sigma-70 factor (ECF subfamily)
MLSQPVEEERAQNGRAIASRVFAISSEDSALVERLRNRDEAAFLELVQRYHASLVRMAQSCVNNRAVAEEVAQETWIGVLKGIDRFEGRASLKTWIFQILINRSKTRGVREARSINFSSLCDTGSETTFSSVDPSRFFSSDDSEHAGCWASQPQQWDMTPEQLLLSEECQTHIGHAIASLPDLQRSVITLRDIEGWDNEEICSILGISEPNCRVLLHRARSRVRQALDEYMGTIQCRVTKGHSVIASRD